MQRAFRKRVSKDAVLLAHGVRSGLEQKVSEDLTARGIEYEYEAHKVKYIVPESTHMYTPDFRLPNGIFVETKGLWETADRMKHLHIRKSNPGLDIRLVFSNSRSKIAKGSKTTYGIWCEKQGIKYADKRIPDDWLN